MIIQPINIIELATFNQSLSTFKLKMGSCYGIYEFLSMECNNT